MNIEERNKTIKSFYNDENTTFRVKLVKLFTPDLHIESVNYPLLILIPPCHFAKFLKQTRVSESIVRFVYTSFEGLSLEKKYYDCMKRKREDISICPKRSEQRKVLPSVDIYMNDKIT